MNFTKLINRTWIWCGLILILTVGIRCYKFSEKENMFFDEYLSVIISQYNEDGEWWFKDIKNDSIKYTGKEVTSLLLSDDNTLQGTFCDISKLRHSTRDLPHTNLYYSLLRTAFLGADTGDISQVMLRGFLLNLLFFFASFFFMYKLASKLFSSKILVVCALCVAFLNPASVGNTLFFRPYQLQEAVFILFSYVFVLTCFAIIEKRKVDTSSNMIGISFVTALTLLTGYFAVFYVLILGLFIIYISYKYKSKSNIKFFVAVFILAYVITIAIYAGYNDGWFSDRGGEAVKKISVSGILENVGCSLKGLSEEVINYLWSLPALLLIILSVAGIFILKKNQGEQNKTSDDKIHLMPLVLAAFGLLWILIVLFFAPYKVVRYIVSMFPILSLFIPFLLSYYTDKWRYIFVFVFSTCLFVHTFMTDICWNAPVIDADYKRHPEIPLVVGGFEDWQQVDLVPYLTDDRIVELSRARGNSNQDFVNKVENYDLLYIVIPKNFSVIYPLPEDYVVENEFGIGEYMLAKKIKRIW